jgi:F-type H+-transporting ATPase subunit gamma
MSSSKAIKNRIKSVKSTKKITKAMELVAASKMKRAVASTLASRPYAEYSWGILNSISGNDEVLSHPFFTQNENSSSLVVLITSDRGLCGAYNAQVVKAVLNFIKTQALDSGEDAETNRHMSFVTVGRKGDIALRRLGQRVVANFSIPGEDVSLSNVSPIAKYVTDEYSSGNYGKVFIVYTDFVSALSQKPNIRQVLPVSKIDLRELMDTTGPNADGNLAEDKAGFASQQNDYLFEGNIDELVGTLAEKLTKMQIYQMMLESNASEQSSRMMAMKNASDASGEMIDDLTLVFNKARQASITQEISEISAGMASVG